MVPVPVLVKRVEPTPAPRTKKKRKKIKQSKKEGKKAKKEKKVKLPKGFQETEKPVVRVGTIGIRCHVALSLLFSSLLFSDPIDSILHEMVVMA